MDAARKAWNEARDKAKQERKDKEDAAKATADAAAGAVRNRKLPAKDDVSKAINDASARGTFNASSGAMLGLRMNGGETMERVAKCQREVGKASGQDSRRNWTRLDGLGIWSVGVAIQVGEKFNSPRLTTGRKSSAEGRRWITGTGDENAAKAAPCAGGARVDRRGRSMVTMTTPTWYGPPGGLAVSGGPAT